jgi:hypothetical protein
MYCGIVAKMSLLSKFLDLHVFEQSGPQVVGEGHELPPPAPKRGRITYHQWSNECETKVQTREYKRELCVGEVKQTLGREYE